MNTFTHHPRTTPFAFDPSRAYDQTREWCKPNGFWLSVDDDWKRWCIENEFGDWDDMDTHHFDVEIDRCLWLRDAADLDNFTNTYVLANVPTWDGGKPDPHRIDWQPLTADYAGIIISPYCCERRLGFSLTSTWYYPWDCASACVWDLSAVRQLVTTLDTTLSEPQ